MPATHLLPLDGKDSHLALTILLALFMDLYGKMISGLTGEHKILYPLSLILLQILCLSTCGC